MPMIKYLCGSRSSESLVFLYLLLALDERVLATPAARAVRPMVKYRYQVNQYQVDTFPHDQIGGIHITWIQNRQFGRFFDPFKDVD